jgi:hypothetical protein
LQIARNTSDGLWSFAWRKEKEGYGDAGVVERQLEDGSWGCGEITNSLTQVKNM